jgi:nucleotide-binding universal stress UspA family protein
MNARSERRFERVCVALEAVSSSGTALDIAANLARQLEVELAGFFIEDENVLRAAALPFTRDVGFVSGTSRPMRLEEVQRAVRAQAEAVKASLAAIAGQLGVRWSFTTVAGAGVTPMLDRLSELNLTVLEPRRTFVVAGTLSPRSSKTRGAVGVVYDGSEEALDAVRVATLIARSRGAAVVLFLAVADEREAGELQHYVQTMAAVKFSAVRCIRIKESSAEGLAGAMRDGNIALLVVPLDAVSRRELPDLLARLSCPLVLISSTA